MNQITVFLASLRRAGAVIRHEGVKAIVRSESALEDCDEDGGLVMDRLLSMSRQPSMPEKWIDNGQPLDQIILGRDGGPHRHRGKTGAETVPAAAPKGGPGKVKPSLDPAAAFRRKIAKLKAEVGRMEILNEKKARRNAKK